MPKRAAAILMLALAGGAHAEDSVLEELRSILFPMRTNVPVDRASRGATPQFDVVKHKLRDWVESRLVGTTWREDLALLATKVNEDLAAACLTCESALRTDPKCGEWSSIGSLEQVKIYKTAEFLIVQTGIGIDTCGMDESAYGYRWAGDRWQRFWQTEENDYSAEAYEPRYLHRVRICPGTMTKTPTRLST